MRFKVSIIIICIIIGLSSNALALTATTTGGYVACFTKGDLDDMSEFVVSKDLASFEAYINSGRCIIVTKGLTVTVLESPGIFGTKAKFAFRGITMWTLREGLKDYR